MNNNYLPAQTTGSQAMNPGGQFDQSNTPVAAFLRNNAPPQGMGVDMSSQMGNSNIMMGNGQPQMNQLNNLNFADLKRLQQLQQQLQATNQAPNPMMQSSQNPSALLFQNYLDQKIQSTRFNDSLNPLAGVGSFSGMGSQNPLINSNLFQEQLMINQNVMGGMKSPTGEMALPSPHSIFHRDGSRRMRGGVIEPFPEKLHRLLLEVEAAGRSDIISFVANGRAFAIHMPDKFFKDIVPLYFRQSRLSSFKRQLNLYGFELINTGPARGGYFHELFVKDRPDLCRKMRRVAVKVGAKSSKLAPAKVTQGEDAIEKADKILKQLDDEQSSRNDNQETVEKPPIESGSLPSVEPATTDITAPATGN